MLLDFGGCGLDGNGDEIDLAADILRLVCTEETTIQFSVEEVDGGGLPSLLTMVWVVVRGVSIFFACLTTDDDESS